MTARVAPNGVHQFFDDNGNPLSAGKVYTYDAGTSTPRTTWADSAEVTPNANPVILDSAGRAVIFWRGVYKVIVKTSADATVSTIDNVDTTPTQTFTSAELALTLNSFKRTAAEIAASVTPSDYSYAVGDLRRYGAVGNNNGTAANGTSDNTAVASAVSANLGKLIWGGGLSYRVGATLPSPSVPAGALLLNGEFVSDQLVTTQDEYSVTALGFKALQANTYIPEQHAASGGRFFASGNHVVALGREALKANTTGRRNTAIGSRALLGNTTGYYNTALGSHTLEVCVGGVENTAAGVQSLQALSSGNGNTGVGLGAGLGVSTGNYNTGVGYGATGGGNGSGQTTGSYNTGVGYRAGYLVTTGTDNVAVGRDAAVSMTTGSTNTAVGATSLTSLLTGSNNTAIGNEALRNTTGDQQTAVGSQALQTLVSGLGCTAVGYQAGRLVTGNYLTAVGWQALTAVSSGANNTALGRSAGATITTGSNNVCVGYSADVSAVGASNQNSIGYSAACTGDNQVTLGNASIATLRCQVTSITALSDARDKADIVDVPLGLDFLETVRPVRFTWNMRDGSKVGAPEAGFIAQELKAAQDAVGADWLGLVDASNPERLEATPGKLLPILVKAVQELAARVRELEARTS